MSDAPDYEGYKVRYAVLDQTIASRQKQGAIVIGIRQGSALLARIILWRYLYLFDLLEKQQKRL